MRVPAWRAMLSEPGATVPYLRRGAAVYEQCMLSTCQKIAARRGLPADSACMLGVAVVQQSWAMSFSGCSETRSRARCRMGEAASRRCGVTAAASSTVLRLGQLVLRSWPAMWTLLRAMSLRTTMAVQDVVPLQFGVHISRERCCMYEWSWHTTTANQEALSAAICTGPSAAR